MKKVSKKEKPVDIKEVNVDVGERDDVVVVSFNKVVSWIGLEPVQAIKLAESLKASAVGILRSTPKSQKD